MQRLILRLLYYHASNESIIGSPGGQAMSSLFLHWWNWVELSFWPTSALLPTFLQDLQTELSQWELSSSNLLHACNLPSARALCYMPFLVPLSNLHGCLFQASSPVTGQGKTSTLEVKKRRNRQLTAGLFPFCPFSAVYVHSHWTLFKHSDPCK